MAIGCSVQTNNEAKCNMMVAMTSSQIVCDGNRAQFANRNQQQSHLSIKYQTL
jgi:hypothetical protein